MVVGVVRETVRDLIADLVGRLVVWAAEAQTIIGAPAAAAQAATAAAKWAARIAQIIKQLVRTLQNLMPLLRRLGDLFEQIRKKMDDLRGKGGGGDKPPDDPRSALLHRQWRTERAGRRGARVLDKRCGRPADLGTYGAVSGAGARAAEELRISPQPATEPPHKRAGSRRMTRSARARNSR